MPASRAALPAEGPAADALAAEILASLQALGTESVRRIYERHGAEGPLYGVKVGDMKPLLKRLRGQTAVHKTLFESGVADAQYLVGLAANGAQLDVATLQRWVRMQRFYLISEYALPWLAAEHPEGWQLALGWLDDPLDHVQAAGWSTLAVLCQWLPDSKLDPTSILGLLQRVQAQIGGAGNRTRYAMNGFVIAAGSGVAALFAPALEIASAVGVVRVDLGQTACKVPFAPEYLNKIQAMGRVGKKRSELKC